MNQWIIIFGANAPKMVPFEGNPRYMRMDCGSVQAWYCRDGRFINDQLFAANDRGLAVCDGVVLNLAELKAEYTAEDFTQVLYRSWEDTAGAFFKKFVGPFCGAVYEQKTGKLTAYANQTGDSFVFYYDSGSFYLISNDLNMIEAVMRENNLPRSLDETAVQHVLTFGFMVDERTLFQEIKRVLPGEMVRFSATETLERVSYHRFSFEPRQISFDDAIELVDQGFRKAVRRCFEKDREYGVEEHLADLSGGLDSRMTSWVACEMGYEPLVFANYCQSGSQELLCASGVASKLGRQFYHKQLDDASFLYEVDRLVDMNYGLAVYFGITGGEQMLRTIDLERFGLEHTGQIGDAVIGSLKKDSDVLPGGQHQIKYSRLLSSELPASFLSKYVNYEDFALHTRAFLGALSSHIIRRHYFYAVSPFIDPDFFALCMSIPVEYRQNHKLYWAWIDRNYPEAGTLPSTRIRKKGAVKWLWTQILRVKRKTIRELQKTGVCKLQSKPDPNNMNPLEYWYQTKPELRAFIEEYYQNSRCLLDPHSEVAKNVDLMYRSSSTMDKLMALTVLAAVKRYFS